MEDNSQKIPTEIAKFRLTSLGYEKPLT